MFPEQKDIEKPLLQELYKRGGTAKPNSPDVNGKNVYESLADYFELTEDERSQLGHPDKTNKKLRNIWMNKVQWARNQLFKNGFISNEQRGIWTITSKAYIFLEAQSESITNSTLKSAQTKVVTLKPSNNESVFPSGIEVMEGKLKEQKYIVSERNKKIVTERRKLDKCTCQACGFSLKVDNKYIIEVHHLNPLANHEERITNIDDLICLCPTCHTIAHTRNPPYTIEEIKVLYASK